MFEKECNDCSLAQVVDAIFDSGIYSCEFLEVVSPSAMVFACDDDGVNAREVGACGVGFEDAGVGNSSPLL